MNERLAFGYGSSGNKDSNSARTSGPDEGVRSDPRGPDEPRVPPPAGRRRIHGGGDDRPDAAFIGLMLFTALLFFRPQDEIHALARLHLAELSAVSALVAM